LTYFDYLTGQVPTGAGLLFATIYTLGRDAGLSTRRAWWRALAALAAMATGALVTVALKQAIVWSLAGSEGVSHFMNNLVFYTGVGRAPESGLALYVHAFRELFDHAFVLTHRVRLLVIGSAATWILAGILCARQGRPFDWLAFGFAALAIPAWIVLMPRHTIQEPAFMVRILVVPIALGVAGCAQALAAAIRFREHNH
jgi:hypothetical protein